MDNDLSNVTEGFNRQNYQDAFILHNNPDIVDKLENIKNRTQDLHLRLKEHHDKHWLIWVRKEQDRIFTKRFGDIKPEHKRLEYSHKGKSLTWNDARRWSFNEARARINSKISMRHDNLDIASKNMRNAVMEQERHRYQQGQSRQHLEQDVKDIHHNTHQQRMALYRDFEENKVLRVETARKNLSATPEIDVFEAYKQQDRELLAQKEHHLTQAYEKHGFDYNAEKHDLTQQYNQKM